MNNEIENVGIKTVFACLNAGGRAWNEWEEIGLDCDGDLVDGSNEVYPINEKEATEPVWSVEWPLPDVGDGWEYCEMEDAEEWDVLSVYCKGYIGTWVDISARKGGAAKERYIYRRRIKVEEPKLVESEWEIWTRSEEDESFFINQFGSSIYVDDIKRLPHSRFGGWVFKLGSGEEYLSVVSPVAYMTKAEHTVVSVCEPEGKEFDTIIADAVRLRRAK